MTGSTRVARRAGPRHAEREKQQSGADRDGYFRNDVCDADGKSAGTGKVTFPVAAHSVPR
jgi:hypothetical protein